MKQSQTNLNLFHLQIYLFLKHFKYFYVILDLRMNDVFLQLFIVYFLIIFYYLQIYWEKYYGLSISKLQFIIQLFYYYIEVYFFHLYRHYLILLEIQIEVERIKIFNCVVIIFSLNFHYY